MLLLIVLSFPIFTFAQECKIKRLTDPYTKETKLTTGFKTLSGGLTKTLVSFDATKTDIEIIFSVNAGAEGKCFDNNSTATLFYEGGKLKGNFKNNSTMNCEGLFSITFRNVATTPTTLKNLATRKVLSIKLSGNAKQVTELSLSDAEQELFQKMATCLVDESKTLLQ